MDYEVNRFFLNDLRQLISLLGTDSLASAFKRLRQALVESNVPGFEDDVDANNAISTLAVTDSLGVRVTSRPTFDDLLLPFLEIVEGKCTRHRAVQLSLRIASQLLSSATERIVEHTEGFIEAVVRATSFNELIADSFMHILLRCIQSRAGPHIGVGVLRRALRKCWLLGVNRSRTAVLREAAVSVCERIVRTVMFGDDAWRQRAHPVEQRIGVWNLICTMMNSERNNARSRGLALRVLAMIVEHRPAVTSFAESLNSTDVDTDSDGGMSRSSSVASLARHFKQAPQELTVEEQYIAAWQEEVIEEPTQNLAMMLARPPPAHVLSKCLPHRVHSLSHQARQAAAAALLSPKSLRSSPTRHSAYAMSCAADVAERSLLNLPVSALTALFSRLNLHSLLSLSATCRRLHKYGSVDSVWRRHRIRLWNDAARRADVEPTHDIEYILQLGEKERCIVRCVLRELDAHDAASTSSPLRDGQSDANLEVTVSNRARTLSGASTLLSASPSQGSVRRVRLETLGGSRGGGARSVWPVLFPNLLDSHTKVMAAALRATLSIFTKHPHQCRLQMELFFGHTLGRMIAVDDLDTIDDELLLHGPISDEQQQDLRRHLFERARGEYLGDDGAARDAAQLQENETVEEEIKIDTLSGHTESWRSLSASTERLRLSTSARLTASTGSLQAPSGGGQASTPSISRTDSLQHVDGEMDAPKSHETRRAVVLDALVPFIASFGPPGAAVALSHGLELHHDKRTAEMRSLARFLFETLDCDPFAPNLLEVLCDDLRRASMPSPDCSESNVLALECLLRLARSLDDTFGLCAASDDDMNTGGSSTTTSTANNTADAADDSVTKSTTPVTTPRSHTPMLLRTTSDLSAPPSPIPSPAPLSLGRTPWAHAKGGVPSAYHMRRHKKLVAHAVAAFNIQTSAGMQRLRSSGVVNINDPRAVALFLRRAPEIDARRVFEFLSQRTEFAERVLAAYCATFSLEGKLFVDVLRDFCEGFLPAPPQKLDYVFHVFARVVFAQHDMLPLGSEFTLFKDGNAIHKLSFAVVMLSKQLHDDDVANRGAVVRESDFVKGMRGVNDGHDLPEGFLRSIYRSVAQVALQNDAHMRLFADGRIVVPQRRWRHWLVRHATESHVGPGPQHTRLVGDCMYHLVSSSLVRALSLLLIESENFGVAERMVNGLHQCARVASHYGMGQCLHEIVQSLANCSLLSRDAVSAVSAQSFVVLFGRDGKAKLCARALFQVAHRYGVEYFTADTWSIVGECVLTLADARLFLLPSRDADLSEHAYSEAVLAANQRMTRSSNAVENGGAGNNDSHSGAFIGEWAAEAAARTCIVQCNIGKLIEKSAVLREIALRCAPSDISSPPQKVLVPSGVKFTKTSARGNHSSPAPVRRNVVGVQFVSDKRSH